MLYVTQDYKEAMALGDRIAVLIDGGIAQIATPAEIYRRPATVGVARLFGDPTINLLAVKPTPTMHGAAFEVGGAPMPRSGRVPMRRRRPHGAARPPAGRRRRSRRREARDDSRVEVVAVTPLNEKIGAADAHCADGTEIFAAPTSGVENDSPPATARPSHASTPRSALLFDRGDRRRIGARTRRSEGRTAA